MSSYAGYSDYLSPTATWDDGDGSDDFLPTPSDGYKSRTGDTGDIYGLRALKRRIEANGGTMDDGSSPPPYIAMKLREIDETQREIEEDMRLREAADAQRITQQDVTNEEEYDGRSVMMPGRSLLDELIGADDDEFDYDEIPLSQGDFDAEITGDNMSASMAQLDSHWQTQARDARIAEAMDVDPSQLALSQSFRNYPSYTHKPSSTELAVAILLDAQARQRSRGARNPARARRRRAQQKATGRLLPGKGMSRWQYEVSLRGYKHFGWWVWSFHDVASFCKIQGGAVAKAYLHNGNKRTIVYRQVQLYFLASKLGGKIKFIHPSRRDLSWKPRGYYKILLFEIRKLLDPEF